MAAPPRRVTQAVIACRNSVSHILAQDYSDISVVKLSAIRDIVSFFDRPIADSFPPDLALTLTSFANWAHRQAVIIDEKRTNNTRGEVALTALTLLFLIFCLGLFLGILAFVVIVLVICLGVKLWDYTKMFKAVASHLTIIGENLIVLESHLRSITTD